MAVAGDFTVDDFDFDLPPDRIALRPARPRDSARLLTVDGPTLGDRRVADLPDILAPGDLLIVNDSRVIPARLRGVRRARGTEAGIEATLLKRLAPDRWQALARPGKRLRVGDPVIFDGGLSAEVAAKDEGGLVTFLFALAGAELDAHLDAHGAMPLPPYIAARRAADAEDAKDYQTVYARAPGSVAAPTAGLHFTRDLLRTLAARGIGRATVTLHVGAGTFLPVKARRVEDHVMHAEWGEVPAETVSAIAKARAQGGRIVAVGTTALRLLESACDETGAVTPFLGETDIFIRPGRPVRSADLLLSNFHLPRSTLLMLIAAFAGYDTMRAAYAHALAGPYRFFSYGDASLWTRERR